MDGKMLARLAAVVFVAVAITATAIELTRKNEAPIYQSLGQSSATSSDPLRAILIHCQELGENATRDPSCLRAWAENRRRFLAPGARPAERLPEPPPPRSDDAVTENVPPTTDVLRKESAPADELPATERPEGQ